MVIVFVMLVLSSLYFALLFNIIVGLRFIYSRYTLIRKSKKNRQHNGQNKKYKATNNDLENIHIKLKIE
jgi:cell division protein FtsB